jgi:hypothetical protein
MCEPTTILLAASAAVGAYGAYSSSQAAKAQAEYQSDVAQANATMAGYQREDALRRGEEDAQQAARQAERMRGTQVARLASNGLDITSGSSLSILEDTAFFGAQDVQTIRNNAAREAWGYSVQADNEMASSQMYSSAARAQNSTRAAGLSLLSSAGQFAATDAGQARLKSWGWS